MSGASLRLILACIGLVPAIAGCRGSPDVPDDPFREIKLNGDTLLIEAMVIGGADGGKLVHGQEGCVELRFWNFGDRKFAVPLNPIDFGKGRWLQDRKPSYENGSEPWFYAGYAAPKIECRFEDASGKVTRTLPRYVGSIPEIAPGWYVPVSWFFDAPPAPGSYRFHLLIDNTPLDTDLGYNISSGGTWVYFSRTLSIDNVVVE